MHDWLPKLLSEIAECAGLDAALTIARKYGGRQMKIPTNLRRKNWLTDAVGKDRAAKIQEKIGYGVINIPLGPTGSFAQFKRELARRFAEAEERNESASKIASTLGITERNVFQRRAKQRKRNSSRQQSLF